jgi:ankyrin repeat protein
MSLRDLSNNKTLPAANEDAGGTAETGGLALKVDAKHRANARKLSLAMMGYIDPNSLADPAANKLGRDDPLPVIKFQSMEASTMRMSDLLLHGAKKHDTVMMRRALEGGADMEMKDCYGMTPFMWCCFKGLLKGAKFLCARGANVDATSKIGNTALMHCAGKNDARMCRWLKQKGAEHNFRNGSGLTALHVAAINDAILAVLSLLDGERHSACDVVDNQNMSPLMHACMEGRIGVVKILTKAGTDIHTINISGLNAMDLAKKYDQTEIYQILHELPESGKGVISQYGVDKAPFINMEELLWCLAPNELPASCSKEKMKYRLEQMNHPNDPRYSTHFATQAEVDFKKAVKAKAKRKKYKKEKQFRQGINKLSLLAQAGIDITGQSTSDIEEISGLRGMVSDEKIHKAFKGMKVSDNEELRLKKIAKEKKEKTRNAMRAQKKGNKHDKISSDAKKRHSAVMSQK